MLGRTAGHTTDVNDRKGSFVERVLDGHARVDQLDAFVQSWLEGPRSRELHEVLGLDADELDLLARVPDALRYLLHARRFDRDVQLDSLRGQARIARHALNVASKAIDPFELAEVESWLETREPSHA